MSRPEIQSFLTHLAVDLNVAVRRQHVDESTLQKAVWQAVRRAGIAEPASCHTSRSGPLLCHTLARVGLCRFCLPCGAFLPLVALAVALLTAYNASQKPLNALRRE